MKKYLSGILSLVLLISMLFVSSASSGAAAASSAQSPVVAYIPLDDRPVNYDRVIYQAKAAGLTLLMPDEDLFRTRLDNQPTNKNGTQYGDCEALFAWLQSVEADCDYFVLSVDQLLSGGLVQSRTDCDYWGILPQDSLERRTIDYLIDLSNRKKVYLFDTVKRLAATAYYDNYVNGDIMRSYGSLPRGWLGGDDLTIANIGAYYEKDGLWRTIGYGDNAMSADDIWALYQHYQYDTLYGYTYETAQTIHNDLARLTNQMVTNELDARRRKLQLTDWLLTYVNTANTYYFLGVDDSAVTESIQTNEINYFNNLIASRSLPAKVYSGADELGMMAIARCAIEHYGVTPRIFVDYIGDGENGKSDQYEPETVYQNMTGHIESLGCPIVDSIADADIVVLAMTIPKSAGISERQIAWTNTIEQLDYLLNTLKKPTIFVDPMGSGMGASDGQSGYTSEYDVFNRSFLSRVNLPMLLGYSCWAAGGNPIGIALGQGVARYVYLKSAAASYDSHIGQMEALTFSYVKDISYKRRAAGELDYYLRAGKPDYGLTPSLPSSETMNFYSTLTGRGWTEQDFSDMLQRFLFAETTYRVAWDGYADGEDAGHVLSSIESGTLLTGVEPYSSVAVESVSLSDFAFPWYRTFEARFSISVTLEKIEVSCAYTVDSQRMLICDVPARTTGSSLAESFNFETAVSRENGDPVLSGYVGTGCTATVTTPSGTVVYSVVITGDPDGDGICSSSDVRIILQHAVGNHTLPSIAALAADLNGDGTVNSSDAKRALDAVLNA